MRVVTVAYLALAPGLPPPQAGTDAAEACWTPVDDVLQAGPAALAFDHHQILADGLERAQAKLALPLSLIFPGVMPSAVSAVDVRYVQ